jgi:hypothetical protein
MDFGWILGGCWDVDDALLRLTHPTLDSLDFGLDFGLVVVITRWI